MGVWFNIPLPHFLSILQLHFHWSPSCRLALPPGLMIVGKLLVMSPRPYPVTDKASGVLMLPYLHTPTFPSASPHPLFTPPSFPISFYILSSLTFTLLWFKCPVSLSRIQETIQSADLGKWVKGWKTCKGDGRRETSGTIYILRLCAKIILKHGRSQSFDDLNNIRSEVSEHFSMEDCGEYAVVAVEMTRWSWMIFCGSIRIEHDSGCWVPQVNWLVILAVGFSPW